MNESVNYKEYLKNVKSVRKKLLIYLRELEFQLYPEEVYKLTHQEEYLEDATNAKESCPTEAIEEA